METSVVRLFTADQFRFVREWSPLTEYREGPPSVYAMTLEQLFDRENRKPLLVAWADTTGPDEICRGWNNRFEGYRRRVWVVLLADILEGWSHFSLVRFDSIRPNSPSIGINATVRQYHQPVQPVRDHQTPWAALRLVNSGAGR